MITIAGVQLLFTLDFINANPIALGYGVATSFELGALSVAASIADLAGSGAKPIAILLGVQLPHGSLQEEYDQILRGAHFAAQQSGAPVVGGDSKLAHAVSVCSTAVGRVPEGGRAFLKGTAEPGDVVWCSGEVGNVAAAVIALEDEAEGDVLDADLKAWVVGALTDSRVRIREAMEISRRRLGHGGTDISDGLAVDFADMCSESAVGGIIYGDRLPIAEQVREVAQRHSLPAWALALTIGGEHEYLVTTDRESEQTMRELGFHDIGEITVEPDLLLSVDFVRRRLVPAGHTDLNFSTFAEEVVSLASNYHAHG